MAKEAREIIAFHAQLAAGRGDRAAVGGLMALKASVDHAEIRGWLAPRMPKQQGLSTENLTGLVLPEGAIRLPDIQTVGMSNGEMERLADATRGLSIGTWGWDILKRAPIAPNEHLILSPVTLDVRTMGIRDECPTTEKVWEKAKEFGDRVTVEEMLQIAIEAAKGNIQVEIGKPLVGIMEPVADPLGFPAVPYVARNERGLFLNASHAYSSRQWNPGDQFVVSSRK